MRGMSPSGRPVRLYPWIVDAPADPPQSHRLLPDAMRDLLQSEGEGSVMVTTWAVVAEYIDENGAAGVAAWASDDPHWRIVGLLHVAEDMLDLYDEEDEDEEVDDD